MLSAFRIPFVFFFVASGIGLLLRYFLWQPFNGFDFRNWVHAHSHLMFLGWVMNALLVAFSLLFVAPEKHKQLFRLFIGIQIPIIGMVFSFPTSGYSGLSIFFLITHTLGVLLFAIRIIRIGSIKFKTQTSFWFARWSLLFFGLSMIGVFLIPIVKLLEVKNGYQLAIYYYLHFQYNGVFIFGLLGILIHDLENSGIVRGEELKRAGYWLVGGTILTYTLSTLWIEPSIVFYIIGFVGAVMQVVFFYKLLIILRNVTQVRVSGLNRLLYGVVTIAFAIKILLQVISSWPSIVDMASENRNYIMAYLHFVFLLIVSLSILAWYFNYQLISGFVSRLSIYLFLIGSIGMIFLQLINQQLINGAFLIFCFSALIFIGIGLFMIQMFRKLT